MVRGAWLACLGCLLQPALAAPPPLAAGSAGAMKGLRLVQEKPIKGQDPMDAMRGQGPTGWVQAPAPRGLNAPQREAQGVGAGQAGANKEGGQVPPDQNPGTPVATPDPNPSGMAPGAPAKQP